MRPRSSTAVVSCTQSTSDATNNPMSRFAVLIEHRLDVVKVGPPGVPGLNEELDVDLGPHELNWMSPKCRSGTLTVASKPV
jgi:hypothetical protein